MEDPWKTTESAAFTLTPRRGELWPPPGRGLSLGRSRSRSSKHHVCVFVYKHDLSYTSGATERPTEENDAVAPSPPREETRRREPPQRQGRATPLHTSTPSPRARRRDRHVARREYTRSSGGQRAAHMSYLKANPQQAASHSKSNTRRERITQARTTNQGPGPPPPRRPHHTSRETRQRAASPKREADAVYPPQHERCALKNTSVECGKARPAVRGPFNKADAASRT